MAADEVSPRAYAPILSSGTEAEQNPLIISCFSSEVSYPQEKRNLLTLRP